MDQILGQNNKTKRSRDGKNIKCIIKCKNNQIALF